MSVLLFPPAQGPISQKFDAKQALCCGCSSPFTPSIIADGTIIFGMDSRGDVIMVEHPYGLLSIYKHNASLTRARDTVRSGEIIATAGNTEYSTGFHLHFELWTDGYLWIQNSLLILEMKR